MIITTRANEVQKAVCGGKTSVKIFAKPVCQSSEFQEQFENFIRDCCVTSEMW